MKIDSKKIRQKQYMRKKSKRRAEDLFFQRTNVMCHLFGAFFTHRAATDEYGAREFFNMHSQTHLWQTDKAPRNFKT